MIFGFSNNNLVFMSLIVFSHSSKQMNKLRVIKRQFMIESMKQCSVTSLIYVPFVLRIF